MQGCCTAQLSASRSTQTGRLMPTKWGACPSVTTSDLHADKWQSSRQCSSYIIRISIFRLAIEATHHSFIVTIIHSTSPFPHVNLRTKYSYATITLHKYLPSTLHNHVSSIQTETLCSSQNGQNHTGSSNSSSTIHSAMPERHQELNLTYSPLTWVSSFIA